jgi:hypothetical protein
MFSFSSTKLPWAICTVFSFIYLWLFTQVSKDKFQKKFPHFESGLMGGFCVWGKPDYPNPVDGCITDDNSHMYAWYVDAVMTMFVAVAYFMSNRDSGIIYVAIGGIVFFHGLLHYFLNTSLHCLTTGTTPEQKQIGWVLYLVFAFFLSLVIFGIGFSKQCKFGWVLVWSLGATFVTYLLARGTEAEWLLSALFATSHPIGSITGLLTTSPLFSKSVGYFFLLATIDGIVELMLCQRFLKAKGGHIWYDIFLHTAVIFALPIFSNESNKKKTD